MLLTAGELLGTASQAGRDELADAGRAGDFSAQLASELQERDAERDRQEVVEVRRRIRQTAGKSKKGDKHRRSEAWWAAMTVTTGYKLFAHEFFTRQVRGLLSPAEQAVFFFIFDRTVWWLKDWETIRTAQFVNGSLPRPDGTRLYRGTGLSERAVRDTLKRLVADGLVLRRDKPGGNGLQEYGIPNVLAFRHLPRFAGENLGFTGRFIEGRGYAHEITI